MITPEKPPSGADLRTIVAHSLVTGLCLLIPAPIVDDWARDLMRRRQTLELARKYGVQLSGVDAKVLAHGYRPATVQGCAGGCLRSAVVTPVRFVVLGILRKLVRKILFFLTLKDVADTASRSLHEGYLVRHALALGALAPAGDPAAGDPAPTGQADASVLAVRRAIEATCAEVDPRPIVKIATTTLRGSRRAVRRAGRSLSRLLRSLRGRSDEIAIYERLEDRGEADLAGLIDEMAADLEDETSYLRRLEAVFDKHLTLPEHQTSEDTSI